MTNIKTVKDTNGHLLILEKTRLREDHANQAFGNWIPDWIARFSDIRKAAKKGNHEIHIHRLSDGLGLIVSFQFATRTTPGRIGCREFDYANFRKILKAAGAVSSRTSKALAKAAKAGA